MGRKDFGQNINVGGTGVKRNFQDTGKFVAELMDKHSN
jgi:hypothetical protein